MVAFRSQTVNLLSLLRESAFEAQTEFWVEFGRVFFVQKQPNLLRRVKNQAFLHSATPSQATCPGVWQGGRSDG